MPARHVGVAQLHVGLIATADHEGGAVQLECASGLVAGDDRQLQCLRRATRCHHRWILRAARTQRLFALPCLRAQPRSARLRFAATALRRLAAAFLRAAAVAVVPATSPEPALLESPAPPGSAARAEPPAAVVEASAAALAALPGRVPKSVVTVTPSGASFEGVPNTSPMPTSTKSPDSRFSRCGGEFIQAFTSAFGVASEPAPQARFSPITQSPSFGM